MLHELPLQRKKQRAYRLVFEELRISFATPFLASILQLRESLAFLYFDVRFTTNHKNHKTPFPLPHELELEATPSETQAVLLVSQHTVNSQNIQKVNKTCSFLQRMIKTCFKKMKTSAIHEQFLQKISKKVNEDKMSELIRLTKSKLGKHEKRTCSTLYFWSA